MLGGAPLGIELAAASIRQHASAEIAAALERTADALTTAFHNVPERHRSLRAAFEHSWGLLTDEAQVQFAQLSVFPDTFADEAAVITGVNIAALNQLADKSLVQRRADGRYQIHSLLRQYATEKLSAMPEAHDTMRRAHCRYYADYLEQHAAWLTAGQAHRVVHDVGAELGNVRAAWAWAVTHCQRGPIAQMLDSLNYFYVTRGWLEEGREVLGRASEAVAGEATPDEVLGARLEMCQAECELWLSNYAQARALLESSRAALLRHGARQLLARVYDLWGTLAYHQGNFAEAWQYGQESLALFRQLDDRVGMAQALNNLANILCDESAAYAEADRLYEESLAIYQHLDDAFGQAKCLINLGSTAQMRAEHNPAKEFYRRGIDLCRASGNRPMLAIALTNLGQLLSTLGQHAEAEQCLLESLDLKREFGQRRAIVFSLKRLGTVTTRQGRYPLAKDYFDEALRLARQLSSQTLTADVLIGVAGLMSARGNIEPALEMLAAVQVGAANDQEIVNEAIKRFAEISRPLAPDVVAACRTRGQARVLEAVVAEVLSEPFMISAEPAPR
jgi:tetratricopeptide (TPR) repeat protein